jgi:DNA-3-methyladenine glycosylase I
MTAYCLFCQTQPEDSLHRIYHDTQYGFPLDDDDALFGRLILEINQAGLSWNTILRKADNFHIAYDGFAVDKVANYSKQDYERLMVDAGIVRNRLKINAAIVNAQRILELQREHGSFKSWLDKHKDFSKAEWTKLFKNTFKFTGGEIVNEFLMSTGYLPGAHDENCHVYQKIHC